MMPTSQRARQNWVSLTRRLGQKELGWPKPIHRGLNKGRRRRRLDQEQVELIGKEVAAYLSTLEWRIGTVDIYSGSLSNTAKTITLVVLLLSLGAKIWRSGDVRRRHRRLHQCGWPTKWISTVDILGSVEARWLKLISDHKSVSLELVSDHKSACD